MSKESIKQKFLDPHHPASFTTVSNFVRNNQDMKDPKFVKEVLTELMECTPLLEKDFPDAE
jgi:hypothetical protein